MSDILIDTSENNISQSELINIDSSNQIAVSVTNNNTANTNNNTANTNNSTANTNISSSSSTNLTVQNNILTAQNNIQDSIDNINSFNSAYSALEQRITDAESQIPITQPFYYYL